MGGPTGSRRAVFDQSVEVTAASITALRRNPAAPALVWPPTRPCNWRLRFIAADAPTPELLDLAQMGEPPVRSNLEFDAATTVVCIEHRSTDLTTTLLGLGNRPLRLMVWTHDEVAGYPRQASAQWTRLTVDELMHVATRRFLVGWTSCLASVKLKPLVEVSDVAPPN